MKDIGKHIEFCFICAAFFCATSYGNADFYKWTNFDPELAESRPLYSDFLNPPHSARPQTWWHVMYGNISREGIEKDLREMADKGYGGAILFSVNVSAPKGPVRFASPEWYEMFSHAVKTARECGIELGVQNCDGFSEAGGPWVGLEDSMKLLACSKIHAKGKGAIQNLRLPKPHAKMDFYKDIAVVAYPARRPLKAPMLETLESVRPANAETLFDKNGDAAKAFDGEFETSLRVLPNSKKMDMFDMQTKLASVEEYGVLLSFKRPYEAGGIYLNLGWEWILPYDVVLESSNDGKNFEKVADIEFSSGEAWLPFAPRKAKFWRLMRVMPKDAKGKNPNELVIREVELAPASRELANGSYINGQRAKSLMDAFANRALPPDTETDTTPDGMRIKASEVLVFKNALDSRGNFKWRVPPGEWRIVHVGYTTSGKMNHPCTPEGRGLEIDKMSAAAYKRHFEHYMQKMIGAAGEPRGDVLKYVQIDSWECGNQNWTQALDEKFFEKNGYSYFSYFPALLGETVGSASESERFFADLRRTTASLVASNFYGQIGKSGGGSGIRSIIEPNGDAFSSDKYSLFKHADIPQDEIWQGYRNPARDFYTNDTLKKRGIFGYAQSVGHFYGKKFIGCESLTQRNGNWAETPRQLKGTIDLIFMQGFNLIQLHCWPHQPDDSVPGWGMGPWGTPISRKQTWWPMSKPFFSYIARMQYMLQQGRAGSRILVLATDGVPESGLTNLPDNFEADSIDGEGVRRHLKLENGKFVSPGKMEYELLAVSPVQFFSVETLRALKKYVEEGGSICGHKKERYATLVGGRKAREEWSRLNSELFGAGGAQAVAQIGKGKVFRNYQANDAARLMGMRASVEFEGNGAKENIRWLRRVSGKDQWFWILNGSGKPAAFVAKFAVSGMNAEIWCPESGERICAVAAAESDGRTLLPLSLPSQTGVFVVFKEGNKNVAPVRAYSIGGMERFPKPLYSGSLADEPRLRLSDGAPSAEFFGRGYVEAILAGGEKVAASVASVPEPQLLAPPFLVEFNEAFGVPKSVVFDKLESWTEHPNLGVKNYSGIARYSKEFDASAPARGERAYLEFDNISEIAEIFINGKSAGVIWKPPFRIEIGKLLKDGRNKLEIDVANTWVNRCLYDSTLPKQERITWSNAMHFHYPAAEHSTRRAPWKFGALPSGIIGGMRVIRSVEVPLSK